MQSLLADARAKRDPWLEMMASLYLAAANVDDARACEAAARRGLALAEARDDSLRVRYGLRWLAYALSAQGRVVESRTLYEKLLPMCVAAGDRGNATFARYGLAYDRARAGRNTEALALYDQTIEGFRALGMRTLEHDATLGRGRVLAAMGRFAEERQLLRDLVQRCREAGDGRSEANALHNLAASEYATGDPGEGARAFERSAAMLEALGDQRWSLTARTNQTLALIAASRYDEADTLLARLLVRARSSGFGEAEIQLRARLGQLRFMQDRCDEASAVFEASFVRAESLGLGAREEGEILSDWIRALRCQRRDAEAAALAERELAPRVARLTANQLGDAGALLARVQLEAGRAREAMRTVDAALAAERAEGTSMTTPRLIALRAQAFDALGRPDSAEAHFARARATLEALRDVPRDPQFREVRATAGTVVAVEEAVHHLRAGGPAASRNARAFDVLQRHKARLLLERMQGPGAFASRATDARPAATLAEVQQRVLGEGEVLLDFHASERLWVMFAVRRDQALAWVFTNSDSLDRRSKLYRRLLADPRARASAEVAARRLSRDLLAPAEPLLRGAKRVLVSADAWSNDLPFAELPLGGAPLGASREIARVPSATVLAELRARARSTEPLRTVLALAGPDTARGRAVQRGVSREVGELASRWAGVRTRRAFDAAEFAGCDVFHFAGHSRVEPNRPWRSVLVVPDAAGDPVDAARIAGLRTRARLAVLSSCESAGGWIALGEGVTGLTGAFLAAGAPAVLASLWPVDDSSTAELVGAFYRALARGRTTAGALRDAQAELRSRPATRAPFHWAGFVLVGDGALAVPIARR